MEITILMGRFYLFYIVNFFMLKYTKDGPPGCVIQAVTKLKLSNPC
jgi:hypothetical protein